MPASRIYVVYESGEPSALVKARSQAEAIRYHTANRFEAVVADQDMLTNSWARAQAIADATKVVEAEQAQERA